MGVEWEVGCGEFFGGEEGGVSGWDYAVIFEIEIELERQRGEAEGERVRPSRSLSIVDIVERLAVWLATDNQNPYCLAPARTVTHSYRVRNT